MEKRRGRKKKDGRKHTRKASATKIVICSGCGAEGHMLATCNSPNADRISKSIRVPSNWFDEKFDIDMLDEIEAANPAVIGEANTNVPDDGDVELQELLKSTLRANNRGKKGKKKAKRIIMIDLASSSDE